MDTVLTRPTSGCTHDKIVEGSGRGAVERPEFRWVNTILGNVKSALPGAYHAVRPKYAQRCRVRVPVQSPIRPARHHRETRLRGAASVSKKTIMTNGYKYKIYYMDL